MDEKKIREEFEAWYATFKSDYDRKPRAIEVWQACAAQLSAKEAEISELRQNIGDLQYLVREYRKGLMAANTKLEEREKQKLSKKE